MSERKENIVKIILSAFLLGAALLFTKIIFNDLPYYINLIFFLPSYLIVGFDVLKEAGEHIIKGKFLDEDFLMGIATLGAIIMGDFPEATFVMLFFLIGETFEETAEKKSESALDALLEIRPDTATVEIGVELVSKAAKDIEIGEIITVRAGERIPLDGIIFEGETRVDTSAVTGESAPKTLKFGEKVYSGSVNLSSVIKIKVTSSFEKSTANRILELVKNATENKAPTERFITKFAKIYTPIVVGLAVLIAIIPSLIFGDAKSHIYSALTFLVISCPCALVISVPLSFFGAIGNASKKGILIKGSQSIETMSALKTVVFDKTGTLTEGTFTVTAIHPEVVNADELLKIAAAVEGYSNHPIAQSIVSYFAGENDLCVQEVSEISGKGMRAYANGKIVLVGNEKLIESYGIEYKKCHHTGSIVHIAFDKTYLGHIVISDKIKEGTSEGIKALGGMGVNAVMLTGDNEASAENIANELTIADFRHSLLPQDKVTELEKILDESTGKVAFVGDGINDAPVLARADVGIAMGALGADSAIEAADIVIMDDKLNKLPELIKISKKALLIAKENIIFSIAVKIAVLLLSAFGVSGIMWLAAFSDAGVLVIAVLNAIRTMKI